MVRCVVGCALIAFSAAIAQPLRVTLQLPFANSMPPRISELMENEQLIRVLVVNTDGKNRYDDLVVSALLEKDGQVVARSKDGHPSQPRWSIAPGESRQLSWREVVSLAALDYDRGLSQQMLTTGELPEGEYRLCMRVLQLGKVGTPAGTPMSPEACAPFVVRPCCPMPIVLTSPAEGALVTAPPLLQWSPCQAPTQAQPLRYRLVVTPRWQVASPQDALQQNPPRIDEMLTGVPQYQLSPVQWNELLADATQPMYAGHVWQVTPYQGDRPCGRPSPIGTFSVLPPYADPAKPTTNHIAVLEWEVPYEELLTGQPVKLTGQIPADASDTLLYVLRLRVPKTLSREQVAMLLGLQPAPSDTLGVSRRYYFGGYYVYQLPAPSDTLRVNFLSYWGGYYVYELPSDTVGQDTLITQQGHVMLSGTFKPRHLLLPLLDLEIGGPNPPVCNLPGTLPSDTGVVGTGVVQRDRRLPSSRVIGMAGVLDTAREAPVGEQDTAKREYLIMRESDIYAILSRTAPSGQQDTTKGEGFQARYTGYVLNQAVASGAGRPSGRTLGAVTRQAPAQQGAGRGPIIVPRPEEVGLPIYRIAPSGQQEEYTGGVVICWAPAPDGRPVAVAGYLDEEGNVVVCWPGGKDPDGRIEATVQLVR